MYEGGDLKSSHLYSVWILSLALSLAIGFQNCADRNLKLSKSVASVSPKVSFCTSPSDSIRSNLKFIFLVDRSGSNQTNFRILPDNSLDGPYPGTDPNGIRRFAALQDFVRNFQGGDDQYIYWSMVGFSSTATRDQGFTNNRAGFLGFLQNEELQTPSLDGGFTNYTDALDEGLQMIMEDVAAQQNADPQISSNYVIFFVSDGVPRVDTTTPTQTEVNAVIQSYFSYQDANRDLVEGVQINTAYYYEDFDDPNAQALLSNMSIEGRGEFLQFGAGETIDFTRFAIPLRISRFELKEFWVHNSNTVWEGPDLLQDTDADTLSDSLERTLGSDPNSYDTDGNGVGDGVEYRSSGKTSPCQNLDCSYVGTPYSTCAQFVERAAPPFFNDRDNDYLNDCEERLLGTEFDNPDTNFDYIPDQLAFVSQTNMIQVSNAGLLDPDNDGFSDYQELKQNTPLRFNNRSVNGFKKLKVVSEIQSQSVQQDCFQFAVDDLGFINRDDRIRVYLMENTQTLSEKRIMRTAEKPLNGGGVRFTESDFQ